MHPMHAPSESDLVSEFYQAYFGYLDQQEASNANLNANQVQGAARLQGAESGLSQSDHSLIERSASAPPFVSNQQQLYRQQLCRHRNVHSLRHQQWNTTAIHRACSSSSRRWYINIISS